jgi:septal ring factor EnvC (AmiA/AmiB activator)
MKPIRFFWIFALTLGFALPSVAQRHHDPLTQPEIDKIRDASWEPRQRLPLYIEFARARLVKLEQVRNDPEIKDRGKQTHDLLDDFQQLYDELNDNIDTYVDRRNDIRKPLKLVVDADTEFQAKLLALKNAADVSPAEAQEYEFVLTNALETLQSSADDHKKLLADQEEQAKHKKLVTDPSAKVGSAPAEGRR